MFAVIWAWHENYQNQVSSSPLQYAAIVPAIHTNDNIDLRRIAPLTPYCTRHFHRPPPMAWSNVTNLIDRSDRQPWRNLIGGKNSRFPVAVAPETARGNQPALHSAKKETGR